MAPQGVNYIITLKDENVICYFDTVCDHNLFLDDAITQYM